MGFIQRRKGPGFNFLLFVLGIISMLVMVYVGGVGASSEFPYSSFSPQQPAAWFAFNHNSGAPDTVSVSSIEEKDLIAKMRRAEITGGSKAKELSLLQTRAKRLKATLNKYQTDLPSMVNIAAQKQVTVAKAEVLTFDIYGMTLQLTCMHVSL